MTAQPTLNKALNWNWGVPDWRDERAYFATHNLTIRQWRWEFMRRRPSYREDWVRWFWQKREDVEKNEARNLREIPGWSKDQALETVMPLDVDDFIERMNKGTYSTIKDPSRQFCDWQLRDGVGYVQFLERRSPKRLQPHRPPGRTERDWNLDEVHLWKFDLTKPLRRQFAIAKATLVARQKGVYGKLNSPKPRRALWPLYLRALDAKDAGAGYNLMARTVWPNDLDKKTPQSARDVYEAAVALRNYFPF